VPLSAVEVWTAYLSSGVLLDLAQALSFGVPWMSSKGNVHGLEAERGHSLLR
jgi:hypothetical protein